MFKLDIDKLRGIEHVTFATESPPIWIELYDDNGTDVCEGLSLCKIDKNFSQYIGLDRMEDNTIYCSDESLLKYHLEDCLKPLGIKLVRYDATPPPVVESDNFVTEETFDKIYDIAVREMEYIRDMQLSPPMYLVGVDETSSIFSVVKDVEKTFPESTPRVFYQAQGLESFVTDSKDILVMQTVVFAASLITVCVVLIVLISSIINFVSKDLMVFYINGMSRKQMIRQFFGYLMSKLKLPIICAIIASFLFYILFSFQGSSSPLFNILILVLANSAVIVLVMVTIRKILSIKISKNTANDKITRILRN